MRMKSISIYFFTIVCPALWGSCKDETYPFIEQGSQQTVFKELNRFERLAFKSSQDLLSAIQMGEKSTSKIGQTRSITFESLLSPCNKLTRATGENYYEALGYDTLVPNKAFAALLNPLGELQVNDTIYKINHNGTYFFPKEKETQFRNVYKMDSLGILVGDKLYKLSDGIYRYKTFPDSILEEEIDLPDDSWNTEDISTRASVSEPNYNSFPKFNADRHTWLGGIRQGLFGNDKYYNVKFNKKRRVRGRLYAYHYVVYSESGVTGMMQKKNFIRWTKTKADELRIGWKNIILVTKIDDPSLKGIPKQSIPIVGGITPAQIPSIGKGNLLDLYVAEVEMKDILNVVGEGLKIFLKRGNSAIGSGRKPTVHAVSLATRSQVYLIILDDVRKTYDEKSITHVFSSKFNIYVTINPEKLPSNIISWAKAVSKTLSQNSFKMRGGEAIICGRLGNDWRGMKIVKEAK